MIIKDEVANGSRVRILSHFTTKGARYAYQIDGPNGEPMSLSSDSLEVIEAGAAKALDFLATKSSATC